MRISLNNAIKTISANTVAQLLNECGFVAGNVAVAINLEFVPRSLYDEHKLNENDKVDVLGAVQGG